MRVNIQRRELPWMKAPTMMAPRYPPIGAEAPKKARLRFRTNPGGFVMPIMATALGMMKAPPIPDTARRTLNAMKSSQNPQPKLKVTSTRHPSSSMFLCPYTAPIRPLIRTNVPCVRLTACESTWENPIY